MTQEEAPSAKNNQGKEKRLLISRVIALVLVIAISIYIVFLPAEQAQKLESYGYFGIFLLSILSNATVLIPAPGLIVVFSMGAKFNPLWVAIAAGLGAAIGELSGYAAGFSGQALIEDRKAYLRMVDWMEKNGPLTVVLLALIPNPAFDLTGIAAGVLKMPLHKFLFWAAIGKIGKMLIVSYAGAGILTAPWIKDFFAP